MKHCVPYKCIANRFCVSFNSECCYTLLIAMVIVGGTCYVTWTCVHSKTTFVLGSACHSLFTALPYYNTHLLLLHHGLTVIHAFNAVTPSSISTCALSQIWVLVRAPNTCKEHCLSQPHIIPGCPGRIGYPSGSVCLVEAC